MKKVDVEVGQAFLVPTLSECEAVGLGEGKSDRICPC